MKIDKIEIEILEDGSLKMSTDKISAAAHGEAESLLRNIIEMAGGKVETKAKPGYATHSHSIGGKVITHSH